MKQMHILFFDKLMRILNITEPSDWYKVKKEDIYHYGGEKLLKQYYNDCVYRVTVL